MSNKPIFFILIFALGFFISCGNNSTGSDPEPEEPEEPAVTTGTLEVTIATDGETLDEDGYELTVGDVDTKASEVDDTITFSEIEEGTYQLELTGIADNCGVDGDNPLSADITAEETTSIDFGVSCQFALKDKIVFGSDRDGSYNIYSMDADGNNIQQLTDHSEYDGEPIISNGGTRIAFESTRKSDGSDLFIIDADGNNIEQITSSAAYTYSVSWSPDDKLLAFNDSRTGSNEIYTISPDGSQETRLTTNSDASVHHSSPSWTPDGENIVYSRNEGGASEIYIMNADGTNQQPVTDYSVYTGSPAVSPDGSKIAFRSNLDGDFKIYIMNIDGTGRTKLTENTPNDLYPSWSPDGSEVVFESTRDGNDEIYKINADGSGVVTNLTNNPAADEMPSWSPFE